MPPRRLPLQRSRKPTPGGPLSAQAHFLRGEAEARQDAWSAAARAYLDSFSAAPDGEIAPAALTALGRALGRLGQVEEACLTLQEVAVRYPGRRGCGRGRGGALQPRLFVTDDTLSDRFAARMGTLLGPEFPTDIALAVSGGGDSMAMLALSHDWGAAYGRRAVGSSPWTTG
jgi:hypothetical protein